MNSNEIHLERLDLVQCSPVSSRGTLKILPLSSKQLHRVVIGDDSGAVRCFEFALMGRSVITGSSNPGSTKERFTVNFETPITALTLLPVDGRKDKIVIGSEMGVAAVDLSGQLVRTTSLLSSLRGSAPTGSSVMAEFERAGDGAIRAMSVFGEDGGQGCGGAGLGPGSGQGRPSLPSTSNKGRVWCATEQTVFCLGSGADASGESETSSRLFGSGSNESSHFASTHSQYFSASTINDMVMMPGLFNSNFHVVAIACLDKMLRFVALGGNGSQAFAQTIGELLLPDAPTTLQILLPSLLTGKSGGTDGWNELDGGVEGEDGNDADNLPAGTVIVLYGTNKGGLGCVLMSLSGDMTILWSLDDSGSGNSTSGGRTIVAGVTGISMADVDGDGRVELCVSRANGTVEMYRLHRDYRRQPTRIFSKNLGQRIQSLQATQGALFTLQASGLLTAFLSPQLQEDGLISSSRGGLLSGFSAAKSKNDQTRSLTQLYINGNLKDVTSNITSLRSQIEQAKQAASNSKRGALEDVSVKHAQSEIASDGSIVVKHTTTAAPLAPVEFSVQSSFELDENLAAYILRIELQQGELEYAILSSPVTLDLVDISEDQPSDEKNGVAVISGWAKGWKLQSQDESGGKLVSGSSGKRGANQFVAVYRAETSSTGKSSHQRSDERGRHLVVALRANEGETGELLLTLVTSVNDKKAAKVLKFDLKPLSLHALIPSLTSEERNGPLSAARNVIRYSGSNLSFSLLSEWVSAMFPSVPQFQNDGDQKSTTLYFRHVLTRAPAIIHIEKGQFTVESVSVSTVAIVKENLTRMANARRTLLEESVTLDPDSISSFLSLIWEKVAFQASLTYKMAILDAIQEITTGEENFSEWLSPEYAKILEEETLLRTAYSRREHTFAYLSGLVTDLFVDWQRLQGRDGRSGLETLVRLLQSGEKESVSEYFLEWSPRR